MHGNPRYAQSSRLLRMILMGTLILLLLLFTPALATAAPGDPDPSFGVGGVVTFDLAQDGENVSAVDLQSDGKIVIAGAVMNSERNSDMLLLRYMSAGVLDRSFGVGGVVVTGISPGSQDEARALLLLPDGKIVIGGYTNAEVSESAFVLVRYSADGSLDPSFGSGGIVVTDVPGHASGIDGLALQGDGGIVAVGSSSIYPDNPWDMVVARYNVDGSLDPNFGTGGIVVTDLGNTADLAMDVAIQGDGRVLVGGITGRNNDQVALVRYLPDGTLDPSFGTHGLVSMNMGASYDSFRSFALLPDGKIVVAANALVYEDPSRYGSRIGLARFLSDGALDLTFGTNGIMLANPRTPGDDMAMALAVQHNGMVVVGGQALSRYTAAGAVDPRFHVSVYDQYPIIYSLAIQPDGKIVAAGVFRPYTFDVWLARFEGDDADADAPTAAPTQSPPPNLGGWNNGDVSVSWNWSDGTGSGIDTANCTQQSTSVGEGEIQLVATCQDLAGNQARAAYTVKVDKTPPIIVAGADTVAGISWYSRDVTVHFTCGDMISGLASSCPPDQVLNVEGPAVASNAQTVADFAGNTSTPSNTVTVAIDKSAPLLGVCPSVGPISAGPGVLSLGPIAVDAGISGLNAGASAMTLPLDTSSVGVKTLDFVAVDNAGNRAVQRCEYRVLYDFTGFFQPVDNLPVFNLLKAGSAVPIKFGLRGFQGLNIFAPGYPASRQIACDSGAPIAEIEQTVAAGGSSLNYDSVTGQYIYVWKTDKAWAGTCRQLVVALSDGTPHMANFRFK